MHPFFLTIFPRNGFDQSVTTPVVLGVLISWVFTETFGWVFAGLVVPGYLASVFLLDAPGGVIDVFEAILTYGIARLIGEHLSRTGVTTRFFGRERFFLVVLVSILVRLAVEAWVLPHFVTGVWAYSVGLVVVPLAANACWKTGMPRGVVQNGVPTLLVYLLLRYVLAPCTNLSLAGFELATQDVAASFLGSPKAYILLVTGALVAAAANVRYGWDFNGILVPALLGLALFKPTEFVATFIETVTLYFTVLLIIRVTPLKRANIEGPRRTVLFFCVDYGLRFAFAAAMGSRVPGEDILSYTGFGYLLPTLLAVKISQKASVPLIVLPTLGVSVTGFGLGTLIGYAATLFDVAQAAPAAATRKIPSPPHEVAAAALWTSAMSIDGAQGSDLGLAFGLSQPWELFDAAVGGNLEPAARAGYLVDRLDGGVLLLRERIDAIGQQRGLPTYLFRSSPARGEPVVVLVSEPRRDPGCVVAAATLLVNGAADAAVVAGVSRASDRWLETGAHASARTLAVGGLLVDLTGAQVDGAAARAAAAGVAGRAEKGLARVRDALTAEGKTHEDPVLASAVRDGELEVSLDLIKWAGAVAPEPVVVPLESAASMAMAFEGVRASNVAVDPEHVVALRRLVLEPLLVPGDAPDMKAPRALVPFAARALGYLLTAPTPGPHGHDVVALLPRSEGLPIALVARTDGVRTRLVDAPVAARPGLRDLALRLGVALDADAVVLGEAYSGGMRHGAMREAQAAATDRVAPQIFCVREREGEASERGVAVATWMDDGRAGPAAARAVEALGLSVERRDLDATLREVATRTLLKDSPLVALEAGSGALRWASVDTAVRLAKRMGKRGVVLLDGTLAEAAHAADATLGPATAGSSDDFAETVRQATADESVVAEDHLALAIAKGWARAVIARTAEGTGLVGVARTATGRQLVAATTGALDVWKIADRPWSDCLASPPRNGVCREVVP